MCKCIFCTYLYHYEHKYIRPLRELDKAGEKNVQSVIFLFPEESVSTAMQEKEWW